MYEKETGRICKTEHKKIDTRLVLNEENEREFSWTEQKKSLCGLKSDTYTFDYGYDQKHIAADGKTPTQLNSSVNNFDHIYSRYSFSIAFLRISYFVKHLNSGNKTRMSPEENKSESSKQWYSPIFEWNAYYCYQSQFAHPHCRRHHTKEIIEPDGKNIIHIRKEFEIDFYLQLQLVVKKTRPKIASQKSVLRSETARSPERLSWGKFSILYTAHPSPTGLNT